MQTQARTFDDRKIIAYVVCVLLMLAGVFASQAIKKIVRDGLFSAEASVTVVKAEEEDEFEDETASRSMTG